MGAVEQQAFGQAQNAVGGIEADLDLALAQQRLDRRQHVGADAVVAQQIVGHRAELVALAGQKVALAGEPVLDQADLVALGGQLPVDPGRLVLGDAEIERERHQDDDEQEQHADQQVADRDQVVAFLVARGLRLQQARGHLSAARARGR